MKSAEKSVQVGMLMHPLCALRRHGKTESFSLAADLDSAQFPFVLPCEFFQRSGHIFRAHLFFRQQAEGSKRIIQPNRFAPIAQLELSLLHRVHDALSEFVKHVLPSSFFRLPLSAACLRY